MIDFYKGVYLIANLFTTYIIFRFINIFFERRELRNSTIEKIIYLSYYILMSYLCLGEARGLNLMVVNILSLWLLSMNYRSRWSRRVMAVSFIYILLVSIEMSVVGVISLLEIEGQSVILMTNIATKLLWFVATLILSNIRSMKKDIRISKWQWMAIFVFPFGSLYIFCTIMLPRKELWNVVSISILLLFNILIFYLYDVLNNQHLEQMENQLIKQQNKYYLKQFQVMEQMQKEIKMLHHDYKNHTITLEACIEQNQLAVAMEYIHELTKAEEEVARYCQSGNLAIDSIINYKLEAARKKMIEMTFEVAIPQLFNIGHRDLSIILGNLLDNAIEAAEQCENEKFIIVRMSYDRGVLYIGVENSFKGSLKIENEKMMTTKGATKMHGFGLLNVKQVVDKYKGELEIDPIGNVFYTDVLIYDIKNVK